MKLITLIGVVFWTCSFAFSLEPAKKNDLTSNVFQNKEVLQFDRQSSPLDSKPFQEHEAISSNLVDIESIIPDIHLELKYASINNFTGQIVYNFNKCLLLKEAALKLREVQRELKAFGLGIKIWDGFRPVAAQWKFWELVPDECYVSDPRKGGRHTRGTAIDLTLVTLEGQELPMPSVFDDFSEKAHRNYRDASAEEVKNRDLLQSMMEKHGFIGLPTEWWHFDLVGWENYPPLDIDPGLY